MKAKCRPETATWRRLSSKRQFKTPRAGGGFHKERDEAVVTAELRRIQEMSWKCFIPRSSRSVSSDTRRFPLGERE